jgi:hypothetical protein
MCGAGDDALPDSRQLHPAARVDAPGAGAVLTGDLPDSGVDAEAPQAALDHAREECEALMRSPRRHLGWRRPRERQGSLVKQRGAPAGEADDRFESGLPCRPDRRGEPRRGPVLLGEGELPRRPVHAQGRGQLARRDAAHDRLGDGCPVSGPVGESVPDQAQRIVSVCLQL